MRTTLILAFLAVTILPMGAVPRDNQVPPALLPAMPDEIKQRPRRPEFGDPKVGFLGVMALGISKFQAERMGIKKGLMLRQVIPNSPAAKAKLRVGDVITAVGQDEVGDILELRVAIRAFGEGDRVTITVLQDGNFIEKRIKLAAAPDQDQPAVPAGVVPGALGLRANPFGVRPAGGGIKIDDGSGSVEIKGRGEAREVVVRNLDDEVQFEGPWYTAQDKASPPPEILQRILRADRLFPDVRQFRPVLPPQNRLLPALPERIRPPKPALPPFPDKLEPSDPLIPKEPGPIPPPPPLEEE